MNELFIALITSVDIFAAVMGLCCSGIRLPKRSAAVVAFVGAGVLCAAAALSEFAADIFGGFAGAAYISKGILLILGLKAVSDGIMGISSKSPGISSESPGISAKSPESTKSAKPTKPAKPLKSPDNAPEARNVPENRNVPKKRGSIFDIAGAPEKADCDSSSEISPGEAAVLGAALSADSVFTGISAGMGGLSPPVIFVLSFISGICACGGGMLAGRLVCKGCGEKFPAGVITGAGLIIIAVFF